PVDLEHELTKLLRENNFFLLDEEFGKSDVSLGKLRGFAEGKYDKQEVALSVMMSKIAEGTTRLVIKAMSEREEKLIDLLRDLSTKCEPYKSHTNEIEVKCTNCSEVFFISESLKQRKTIICEICGEENKV
ncbi:MAG: hypothetical protein KGD74_04140, partial [Candidatus Lokiarchaeota archaeon]|nr:hypothetical protein [Candidatus Lokiarchaeota archaeon]